MAASVEALNNGELQKELQNQASIGKKADLKELVIITIQEKLILGSNVFCY